MQSYSVEAAFQAIKLDNTHIRKVWSDYSLGYISIDGLLPANTIRQYGLGKPCACCSKKMARDRWSQEPVNGWLHENGWWKNPRNVTIDHRYPKSLFPELMFDPNNMELLCLKCNQDKGDLFGQTLAKDCKYYAAQMRSKIL